MTTHPGTSQPERAWQNESPPRRTGHEAIGVETYVTADQGRWKVEIAVVFPDEAVRRTVNHYHTQRHADIAASWIKRAAQRDIKGPDD